MFKLRPVTLCVTLLALLAFSKRTNAQNSEKIKADLIFKMLDFDARFRMLPGYRDSACRMDLANQAKTEYLDFKQTYQANTTLFLKNEREKLNEVVESCDRIFLKDEVFSSLKQPDYLSSKNPSKGEVMDKKWIDIHKACLYVLIKDLTVRSNYELLYEFSRLAAAADVARNGLPACHHYADSLLTKGGSSLDEHFQKAQLQNSPESNSYFQQLITAFKSKAADLPEQTKAMYASRNMLILSPEGEEADIHLMTRYPATPLHLDGLIKELTETDKYAIVASPAAQRDMRNNSIFFQTKAHKAGKDETADYTFQIITPGVLDVQYNRPEYYTGFLQRGYISIITYRCPISINVMDKEGRIERTFVVVGENNVFSDTLHANIMNNLRPGWGMIPFPSDTACYDAMADVNLKNSISNMLFSSKWNEAVPTITTALNNGYGYWKVWREQYIIYGVKNPEAGYQDIANIVDSTDDAIRHLDDESLRTSSKATLSRMLEKYQEILKRPDLSHNVRLLCMRNSIQAAMLSDQLERTMTLVADYKKVKSDDVLVPSPNFKVFSFRYWMMKNSAATVTLPQY
ncbi:hypothetical protein [Chitinophaga filiformis]|uniref:Uncharacterized protein n=1 Tax=Chitinophaga filiformis TaxID=104663 RepID=A0A1G8B0V4_CHIFI|nr:hypothetical protein [Chitinophaga filiformis]SDH26260.1 hypothetical protein SAMN04488121_11048 [Chitinophaga filiformis]